MFLQQITLEYTYSSYDLLFKREKSLIISINQQSIIVY